MTRLPGFISALLFLANALFHETHQLQQGEPIETLARLAAPDLRITVRTAYDTDVKRLEEAGATHVIAAESAAADAIIDQVVRNIDASREDQPGPSCS